MDSEIKEALTNAMDLLRRIENNNIVDPLDIQTAILLLGTVLIKFDEKPVEFSY